MTAATNIQLAFYGDDLTGSTDALEFISNAGLKSVLFMELPTISEIETFPGLQAFGVAGKTRSLSPAEMEKILLPSFEKIKATGARHVHYKVCSTFDSSAQTGSIGKAIDCGAEVFKNKTIPVVGGMPALGRYCVFGNLFARMGTGATGKLYRLDRHPSMSKHPITPADESDLRLHLGRQTKKSIGLIDVLMLDMPVADIIDLFTDEAMLIDALDDQHIKKIGALLESYQAREGKPLFSVGSSGVELALANYWKETQLVAGTVNYPDISTTNPLLIVAGSCSPVTAAQIQTAISQGFEELIIDAVKICSDGVVEEATLTHINQLLKDKKNVIVHTGTKNGVALAAEKLGTALGAIAKEMVEKQLVTRVIVAGGDTSSFAARALEIDALEMITSVVPGAPLCRAISKNKFVNGLEVNFKGGQVGTEDYFIQMTGRN